MSEVNDEFYQSKAETFHGFIKVTIWSIAAIVVFLAFLGIAFT